MLLELRSRQAGYIWAWSLDTMSATRCIFLLRAACLHPASPAGSQPPQVSTLGLLQGQLPVAPLRIRACMERLRCRGWLIQAVGLLG